MGRNGGLEGRITLGVMEDGSERRVAQERGGAERVGEILCIYDSFSLSKETVCSFR